jgi:hypothetical protein
VLPAPSLDDLAAQIRQRLDPNSGGWRGPYILFLGEGCARAAGAPSREELARQALSALDNDPTGPLSASTLSGTPDARVFEQFTAHTSSLSSRQFARMLRQLYANLPVPAFYQDLALLIREQYFPLVVTMNFDTLLEQALAAVGVGAAQYKVTTFGRGRTSTPVESDAAPLTHLVKLHGDLAQDIAHVNPGDIENALMSSKKWIKSDLAGDMVMVEHDVGRDAIIDRWLAHAPDRELWWVSESTTSDLTRVQAWSARPIREITGEIGRPNVFFPQLALRMYRSAGDDEPVLESFRSAPALPQPGETALQPGAAQALQVEIRRNQAVLNNLDQNRLAAQESPQLSAQIQYQKRRMWHLEDRLRSLPEVQPLALDCVRTIAQSIRNAPPPTSYLPADEGADLALEAIASYVDRQADAVAKELESQKPNQVVIAASLSATLAVADRLRAEYGDAVIDAGQFKQLADLVPTAAGKVVV